MDTAMERRAHSRRSVAWDVRVWLAETLGFIEAKAVDASSGGLGIALEARPATKFLAPGRRYRIDLIANGESFMQDHMTIRHVTADRIGVEFERPLPIIDDVDAGLAGTPDEKKPSAQRR
jgi:PilZ domain-containing protein